MKIRHGIIISIGLLISTVVLNSESIPINLWLQETLTTITGMLWLASLALIAYLIVRNIFRAIKGAVTGTPQSGGYRGEARRACEKVTPKKDKQKQDSLPWEG